MTQHKTAYILAVQYLEHQQKAEQLQAILSNVNADTLSKDIQLHKAKASAVSECAMALGINSNQWADAIEEVRGRRG